MKLIDCFLYHNEDLVLDIRLNTLNEHVDQFVIVESNFDHQGNKKRLNFDFERFKKFKHKINYQVIEKFPGDISNWERENYQRNFIENGIADCDDNDYIIISDVDEIPDLSKINFNKLEEKIIIFKQNMFYYKFNLRLPDLIWGGTKGCKKKHLINPQWLRNIKNRGYSFFRIDALFSKIKYMSVKIINNGGWHFTNIKTAEEIEHKLKSYLHHREFDVNPLSVNQINEIIKEKKAIYDLNVDKSSSKIGRGKKLEKFETNKLPIYIQQNLNNLKEWID